MDANLDNEETRIDKYLSDEMQPGERADFEEEILNNSALREEVEFERQLRQTGSSIHDKITQSFSEVNSTTEEDRDMIRNIREKWEADNKLIGVKSIKDSPVPKIGTNSRATWNMWPPLVAAASLIGVIIITLMISESGKEIKNANNLQTDSPKVQHDDSIRRANARPDDNIVNQDPVPEPSPLPRALNKQQKRAVESNFIADNVPDDIEPVLQEPLNEYLEGNYQKTATLIDAIDPTRVSRGSVYEQKRFAFRAFYYSGMSHLSLKDFKTASQKLEKALQYSPDPLSAARGRWYLSLSYLNENKIEAGFELLNKLAEDRQAGIYRSKAISLKKQLN